MQDFDRYISHLENDIRDAKTPRQLAYKKHALEACRDYKAENEAYIKKLEDEALEMQESIIELRDHIHRLEAILIIHGISDFPAWFEKGTSYLVDMALELEHKKQMQIPAKLKDKT